MPVTTTKERMFSIKEATFHSFPNFFAGASSAIADLVGNEMIMS
jgi:hypothetical protein